MAAAVVACGGGVVRGTRAATAATFSSAPHAAAAASPLELTVVYGDAGLLVVNKPAGLLSVPGIGAHKEARNAAALVRAWCRDTPAALHAMAAQPSAFHQVAALAGAGSVDAVQRCYDAVTADAARTGTQQRSKLRKRALQAGGLPYVASPALLEWARRRGALDAGTDGDADDGVADDFRVRPRVVHRLDEGTSGALLFGLTPAMQRALSIQFIARSVRKVYEAVVDTRALAAWRTPSPLATSDAGTITTPLQPRCHAPLWHPHTGAAAPDAAAAVTQWRVVRRTATTARLRLEPATGRTHQLRLHCALPPPWGLGAAIVGDAFYHADGAAPAPPASSFRAELIRDSAAHGAAHAPWLSTAHLLFGPSARAAADAPRTRAWAVATDADADADDALCAAPPRLLLHAAEVHIVDHFNYADTAVRAAGARNGGAPGCAAACTPAAVPCATYGDVRVSWAPTAAGVRTYDADVDDRGDGHAARRRVVAFTLPTPF